MGNFTYHVVDEMSLALHRAEQERLNRLAELRRTEVHTYGALHASAPIAAAVKPSPPVSQEWEIGLASK